MEPRRRIATVLFTDIVGSTQRAAALGDRRWREVLRAHHTAVRDQLRLHYGHEISTAGDGFLAVFESPAHALLCAAAIREAVRPLDLAIRCGLHMGEVEHEDGDVGGLAVHIGARVAALAAGGEILVSGTVRDAEAGSDFRFEDRGRQSLRGVDGEWRIYALTEIPEVEAAALPSPPAPPGFRERIGDARLAPVLAVYLGVGVLVFLLALWLRRVTDLPEWTPWGALLLLVIGLVIVTATAWVQARPQTALRQAHGELPGPRELDLRGAARAVASGELPHLNWGRTLAGGVFAFAMLFGLAGLWVVIQNRGRPLAPDEALAEAAPGIAVLPFSVQGDGLDAWREGAVDLIGSNLDGAAGLRAIDSRTLLARWHEGVEEGEEPDLETSLSVARRAGARYALLGSAVALGPELRLRAEVYEVRTARSLGEAQVDGSPDSVYMLVDRLSLEVLQSILGEEAEGLPRVQLARATTASLPALKAYLEGEVHYRRADWRPALEAYQEAVDADSTFALAWLRIAQALGWIPTAVHPARADWDAIQAAARHAERLSEREATLVHAYRAMQAGAMTMREPLEAAVRRYPDDPELVYLLGEYYVHFGDQLLVERAETRRALDAAIALDPSFAPFYQHAIEYAFYDADSARALELLATYEPLVDQEKVTLRRFQSAAALVWNSPPGREEMRAALDTLDLEEFPLDLIPRTPRYLALDLEMGRKISAAGGPPPFEPLYVSGRFSAVDSLLQASRTPPGMLGVFLMMGEQAGIPVDPDRLRDAVAADTLFPTVWFAAVLAARERRTADLASLIAHSEAARDRMLAAGDSLMAGTWEGWIQAVEGYEALGRGDQRAALELLQDAQRRATGWGVAGIANQYIRWTVGELLVDLGRPEEAIPYFRTPHNSAFALATLGRIYQDLGRDEEAKEAFETALAFWRDADPSVASLVADVRQRLASMGFRPRD